MIRPIVIMCVLMRPASAGGLVFDELFCDGTDLREAFNKALDLAIASPQTDCRRDGRLRDIAVRARTGDLPHDIHVACARPWEWPHTSCGVGEASCRPADGKKLGLIPASDATIRVSFRDLQIKGYGCPLIPDGGDFGIAAMHELAHADQVVHGLMDTRQDSAVQAMKTQVFAIEMENILRRSQGQCQRYNSGTDDKNGVKDVSSVVQKCECDPMGIDRRFGTAPTCAATFTCCNRRCVAVAHDAQNCGGCGQVCDRCCSGGTCAACTRIGPACDYLDSATASSVLGREIVKTDQLQGTFACNFYGKAEEGKPRPDYAIMHLLVMPHGGITALDFGKLQRAEVNRLGISMHTLDIPLGMAAYVLDLGKGFLQVVVLAPNATFNVGVGVQSGLPVDAEKNLVATAQAIFAKLAPGYPSVLTPAETSTATTPTSPSPTPPASPADEILSGAKFVAVDDEATTVEGLPVTIDVLANDKPRLPATGTSVIAGIPLGGTVKQNLADDTLAYTPRAGFVGTDQFSYTVIVMGKVLGGAKVRVTVIKQR